MSNFFPVIFSHIVISSLSCATTYVRSSWRSSSSRRKGTSIMKRGALRYSAECSNHLM